MKQIDIDNGCKGCHWNVEYTCRRFPPILVRQEWQNGYGEWNFAIFNFPIAIGRCGEYKVEKVKD